MSDAMLTSPGRVLRVTSAAYGPRRSRVKILIVVAAATGSTATSGDVGQQRDEVRGRLAANALAERAGVGAAVDGDDPVNAGPAGKIGA
jgi:hypothetical protein